MTRRDLDERLWDSVHPVQSIRKDDRGHVQGLGTAFVCGRQGATAFLLTCWHVVKEIGEEHLRVAGHVAEVVAQGDKALDLALLKVRGFRHAGELKLSRHGRAKQGFRTIGHFWANEKERDVPDSRPLDGQLGERRRKTSETHGSVPCWEFSVVKDDVFDRIRAGYSGAPVLDPETGLVVAVVSHQEGEEHGHAVAVANLESIYDGAHHFFADAADGEGSTSDHWLAKTLDHEQAALLRAQLEDGATSTLAVIEGCVDDWPKYLADDVFLDPWPALDELPQEATTLEPSRYGADREAFWSAVHHCVPAPQQADEAGSRRDVVRNWLRGNFRHVFCVSTNIARKGLQLPRLVRAARGFLDELSTLEPDMRILMLIVCQPVQHKPPWWWRPWVRFRLKRLAGVLWLEPLREIARPDLDNWYNSFSDDARRSLRRDSLRDELLELFDPDVSGIRYQRVRQRLIVEGALERARVES